MPRLLSVSIPDELASETEALARARGKAKSEVVREALHRHLQHEHFADLQRYGRGRGEKMGVGPEDVEGLIDAVREYRGVRIVTPQALLAELATD